MGQNLTYRLAKPVVLRILSPGETYRLAKPIAWRNPSPGETYRLAKPMAWQSLTKHSSWRNESVENLLLSPIQTYRLIPGPLFRKQCEPPWAYQGFLRDILNSGLTSSCKLAKTEIDVFVELCSRSSLTDQVMSGLAEVRVSQLVESCVESSVGVPGVVRLQVGAGVD
jgi:hypothetical protein